MIGWAFTEGSVPNDRLEAERLRATNEWRPPKPGPDYLFENTPDTEPDDE